MKHFGTTHVRCVMVRLRAALTVIALPPPLAVVARKGGVYANAEK